MHSHFAFLALDVARERSLEAERHYFLRRGLDAARRPSWPRRLLGAAVRSWRSRTGAEPVDRTVKGGTHARTAHG